jgi:cardiolipin synthase
MAHRSILIFPEDSITPIAAAIHAAKESLKIKLFVFSDLQLIAAVITAKKRGARVQVILNARRRSGEADNQRTGKLLEAAGIEVKSGNPDFGLTHEKSMIVDDRWAFIQSLNWEPKNLN